MEFKLRACWYKHNGQWRGGKFHQWGMRAEDNCMSSYGIIEDDETGQIVDPEPWNVHFGADPQRTF